MHKLGFAEDRDWLERARMKDKYTKVVIQERIIVKTVEIPAKPHSDDKPAVVYRWDNPTTGLSYIGYTTQPLDVYIASSQNQQFWDDYHNPEHKWTREIVFFGSHKVCRKKEAQLILAEDPSNLYNSASMHRFKEKYII